MQWDRLWGRADLNNPSNCPTSSNYAICKGGRRKPSTGKGSGSFVQLSNLFQYVRENIVATPPIPEKGDCNWSCVLKVDSWTESFYPLQHNGFRRPPSILKGWTEVDGLDGLGVAP